MNKNKQNKALAAVLATSILVTGTFAWQSFSQTAVNETITEGGLAGGRLHDYFFHGDEEAGVDRVQQVFVENYAKSLDKDGEIQNPNDIASTIYARVRLSEYMESGYGAGILPSEMSPTDDQGDYEFAKDSKDPSMVPVKGDKRREGVTTPEIDKPETWDIYLWGSEADDSNIRTYRDLEFGGNNGNKGITTYLPTFNQVHEGDNEYVLKADINGTMAGTYIDVDDDNKVKVASRHDETTAYNDYLDYSETGDVTGDLMYLNEKGVVESVENVVHTPTETIETTKVISMSDWLKAPATGNFWVYDTDGWAYWANPITANTATGLLLAGIEEKLNPEGTRTYYAVHAEAQLATAGDWGDAGLEGTIANDITSDGEFFLDCVVGGVVARDGLAQTLEILGSDITSLKGSESTIKVDGVDFYVLDVATKATYATSEGGSATNVKGVFLYSKETWGQEGYKWQGDTYRTDGYYTAYWQDSHLQASLVDALEDKPVLSALTKYVDTTIESLNVEMPTLTSYDKAFPLSEDEIDHYDLLETNIIKDSSGILGAQPNQSGSNLRWLRSASAYMNESGVYGTVAVGSTNGLLSKGYGTSNAFAVRLGMWVEL